MRRLIWSARPSAFRFDQMGRLITFIGLLVLVVSTSCRGKESVHSELIREHQRGFELVSVENSRLYSLSFDSRTLTRSAPFTNTASQPYGAVSPDGKRIAIGLCSGGRSCSGGPFTLALVETGNKEVREFEGFMDPGIDICWSHDSSKLALTMTDRRHGALGGFGLQIVNLKTGENRMIWEGPDSFVVAQCWSPDDKRIVFSTNKPGGIRITRVYDVESKQSSDLAVGGFPTWSPDGSQIAFLHCPPWLGGCEYYAIRVKDGKQELLFKPHFAESGLFWSPDSRFVAYIGGANLLDSKPSSWFRETRRLRVRRLEDNAEEPFLYFSDGDVMWFDWLSEPVPLGF